MPFLMMIYLLGFALTCLCGLSFSIKDKISKGQLTSMTILLDLYEFLETTILILMSAAYFSDFLRQYMGWHSILIFCIIIGIDFYLSLMSNRQDMGFRDEELSINEFEFLKALSLLFSAPAYLVSLMLCCELISPNL